MSYIPRFLERLNTISIEIPHQFIAEKLKLIEKIGETGMGTYYKLKGSKRNQNKNIKLFQLNCFNKKGKIYLLNVGNMSDKLQ